MDCRQVIEYLDDFLAAELDETERAELAAHLEICPSCAREYALAKRTMALLQPSQEVHASSNLKERIMNAIAETNAANHESATIHRRRINLWRPAWIVGVVASLLLLALLHQWLGRTRAPSLDTGVSLSGFGLFSQAWAREDALFDREEIVHLVNEIVVRPVPSPELARMRWIPLVSLDTKGKPRFNQLRLPAKPGEGFTILDETYYDPHGGRFSRVMTLEGKPVFANSYDGEAIYSLGVGPSGAERVARNPIASDFKPLKRPAEFLGIAAGMPRELDENDKSLFSEAGEATLSDGSKGRMIKAAFGLNSGPDTLSNAYWLFTIRETDNTIVQREWFVGDQSVLLIRRLRAETVEHPSTAWNLSGIQKTAVPSQAAPGVCVTPDAVIPDASIRDMVERADFETYIFAHDPPWAKERRISDILDVASPPHRMYSILYRAEDGRHVVLVQSYTYNTMLGPVAKEGRLVYESPTGFKVWSASTDKWLAGILLQSSGYMLKEPPSPDRTGYLLESPAGTFPAIAINGKVNDEELHALVNSLVPARDYKGK
jgi:anti-sigma factor (TIGR02949 family)